MTFPTPHDGTIVRLRGDVELRQTAHDRWEVRVNGQPPQISLHALDNNYGPGIELRRRGEEFFE